MKLEIGSEERFRDFIKGIGKKDKVALISHADLDGIGAAKVVYTALKPALLLFLGYGDLNASLVQTLKEQQVTKIIFTDLFVEERNLIPSLEVFADILIIDHHTWAQDYTSPKTVLLKCEEGYCAAYFCYELFFKDKVVPALDWLVACACISDFCNVKNVAWMKKVFARHGVSYKEDFTRLGFTMDDISLSRFHALQWEITLALIYFDTNIRHVFDEIGSLFGDIGDLKHHAREIATAIDHAVASFEKEKRVFPGGYYWEFSPQFRLTSIVSNLVSQRYPSSTLAIARDRADGFFSVSMRRQDRKEDMNALLKKLIAGFKDSSGGGHVPAAGGFFPKEYATEFKRRLGVKG